MLAAFVVVLCQDDPEDEDMEKAGAALATESELVADVEAIGRLISLSLRSGIPMAEIHRQLRHISSDKVIGLGPNKVMSVPDAIVIAIEKWMQEKQGVQQDLLPAAARAFPARPRSGRFQGRRHCTSCPPASSSSRWAGRRLISWARALTAGRSWSSRRDR